MHLANLLWASLKRNRSSYVATGAHSTLEPMVRALWTQTTVGITASIFWGSSVKLYTPTQRPSSRKIEPGMSETKNPTGCCGHLTNKYCRRLISRQNMLGTSSSVGKPPSGVNVWARKMKTPIVARFLGKSPTSYVPVLPVQRFSGSASQALSWNERRLADTVCYYRVQGPTVGRLASTIKLEALHSGLEPESFWRASTLSESAARQEGPP